MLIEIICTPLGRGRYAARLGDRLLCESRTPFFSSARTLLTEGCSPEGVLVMRHVGSESIAMRWRLGLAAGLTVRETETAGPVFETYRDRLDVAPFPGVKPRTAGNVLPVPEDLSDELAAVALTPGKTRAA